MFGAFQAKTAIRKEDYCFVVEGYTGVVSLHQNGIENVVASSGTSLTIGQIRLIKRFTNNLVILYDGDQAGVRAALRGLDLALEEDMAVRVVILPDGEDPDSFVQKVGKEDFSVFIKNNAQDIIQLEAGILLQQSANDPTKRAELIGHIAHTISRVKNPIRRDEYIRNVRELLQVDEGKLVLEINRILQKEVEKFSQRQELESRGAPASSEQGADTAPGASEKGIAPEFGDGYQEKDIARLLITAGNKRFDSEEALSVAEYVLMNIEDVLAEFDQPLYKQVVEITFQLVMDKREVSLDFFLHHPEESIRQLAINLSSSPYEYSENWEKRHDIGLSQNPPEENHRKDAENLIKRFKLRKIRRFKERNARKMNDLFQANGPDEEIEACMQLHLKLKAIETQLAKELGTVVLK
ncbi:MAG: toprim domain-containing protein [Haliscomenobacter sp.]|nr:toprim domain-containing protein [Haliscomenobacter sp.]